MEWKKFVLTTTTEATDFVSGILLENGINSFEIEDGKQISAEDKEAMYIDILPELTDDGTAKMIFYMDMNTNKAEEKRILDGIREGLEELKLFVNVGEASIIESVTDEKEWIDKWKEFFEPFTVDDILIRPTWKNVENEGDYKMVLQIDPGTAFGTGLHETTQLCIRQLRKYITNETNLLDVGCGSGILSVIGRKLGAAYALGIDIDKVAVEASAKNAEENGIISDIRFMEGNIIEEEAIKDETGYECYDIVVANILADIIIPLSKVIAPHMKVGGLFITSGIIFNKEEQVTEAIEENESFRIKEIIRQKDWVSITAERIK